MSLPRSDWPEQPRAVLLVGDAASGDLASALEAAGYRVLTAEAEDAGEMCRRGDPAPSLVLLPALREVDALRRLVADCHAEREGPRPSVVVRCELTEEGVAAAYEAGADDVLYESATKVEILGRVRGLLRQRDHLAALAQKERDAQVMLELTQALASTLDFGEILFRVVRRIAEVVNVDRASIVLVPDAEVPDVGYVVATSDDEGIASLRLDLEKYPEIQTVLRSGEILRIDDAATHSVLEGVRAELPAESLGTLTLLPIVWQEESLGVLFLRSARRVELGERETDFCRIVANATAIALRNARVMQSLRDHTQKVNFARFEAERRLRALERYANLFASAADGLAAMDGEGKVLFANPRAYEIVGVDEADIRGKSLRKLVHADDKPVVDELWAKVSERDYPRGVDLRMSRPDGTYRVVSCSFSELLDSEGAILVSFRDVTADRETASELVQTKEFLESLINASVDAIIAADLKGRILLFNKGAERIYGYRAEDVVGRMNALQLYPNGRAREVMRMLRSAQHGGPGRLESTRFEAVDREGRSLPIMLSAALIDGEDGRPHASVGIFTDLRDKLRVEERLAQAQQKLAVTEKQALIAELAGTAAHELNQPLTSVIGYAELLTRKLEPNSPERHAAEVIVREAERMADIVRKIGKITRYETKSYVGTQRILDLDKSSDDAKGRP